jgi:hypothetical protein
MLNLTAKAGDRAQIEEVKNCSTGGFLDLKFNAIEEILSFLPPQKGLI